MRYQKFDERYVVRLESGDKVMAGLTALAEREGIHNASLHGLGAVRQASVAWYDDQAQRYETHDLTEQLEVTSIIGNVALRDGKPFIHAHVNLSRRDLSAIGGHLMEAEAHATMEIWLRPEEGELHRLPDAETGLYVLDLAERL